MNQPLLSGANLRFLLICLVLFLLGGYLRIQSGWLHLSEFGAPVNSNASAAAATEQLPPELGQTVLSMFENLDRGLYKETNNILLMPVWQPAGENTYRITGLMTEDEFLTMATTELGSNGSRYTVIGILVMGATLIPEDQRSEAAWPELLTLRYLPEGVKVESVYQVDVLGSTLDRCAPWDWRSNFLVAKLSGNGGWKMLAPGGAVATEPYFLYWLRGQDPVMGRKFIAEK